MRIPPLPRACEKAGITFVGPSADIAGSARRQNGGAQTGTSGQDSRCPRNRGAGRPATRRVSIQIAGSIGFPLIIKAAFGGGGRGMRVVDSAGDLKAKLRRRARKRVRRSATLRCFWNAISGARNTSRCRSSAITQGNILHLYERDCCVQRRHQKVVEIAPAIGLPAKVRQELAEAAVALARTAGYYNAGTVEFLVDADTHEWFFIEVNPRVQVEHTVTEMITGIDIVRTQIQVAQGLNLHGEEIGLAAAGRHSPAWDGASMQSHDGRPGQRLRSGLRQDPHVSLAGRVRNSSGCGIGLWWRSHFAVLRFAAGEGDRLGQLTSSRRASAWTGLCVSFEFAG